MEKMVIAGSGPAGWTAALYAARAGLAPQVVEGVQPGGQLTTTTEVENYPGFPVGIDGTALVANMKEQALRFGARAVPGTVTGSDFSGRPLQLFLEDGATAKAETCIVATGAAANYLGLESEQRLIGRGVSGCATCDGPFFRDQPVAVVGGGDTAMEDALFLARIAKKVFLIHRRDAFRASRIMAERALAHPAIETLWNTVVVEALDGGRNELTGLRLRNVVRDETFDIDVSGMFLAIGHTPNTAPFRGQIDIDKDGFILAQHTKTSAEGVFAAGDVQDRFYRQAITAAGTGCMAALQAQRFLETQGK